MCQLPASAVTDEVPQPPAMWSSLPQRQEGDRPRPKEEQRNLSDRAGGSVGGARGRVWSTYIVRTVSVAVHGHLCVRAVVRSWGVGRTLPQQSIHSTIQSLSVIELQYPRCDLRKCNSVNNKVLGWLVHTCTYLYIYSTTHMYTQSLSAYTQ